MNRNEIDRDVISKAYDDALKRKRPLQSHRLRIYISGHLFVDQSPIVHVGELVKRCIARGYIERYRRGEFIMTQAGLQWIGHDGSLLSRDATSVANLP